MCMWLSRVSWAIIDAGWRGHEREIVVDGSVCKLQSRCAKTIARQKCKDGAE